MKEKKNGSGGRGLVTLSTSCCPGKGKTQVSVEQLFVEGSVETPVGKVPRVSSSLV